MVNNNRFFVSINNRKKVEKYVDQFLNDYIKRDLFEPKNKCKLRKHKNNCMKKIYDLFKCKKNAKIYFNKELFILCGKYFLNDKKIIYNTKDICKIMKQINNC